MKRGPLHFDLSFTIQHSAIWTLVPLFLIAGCTQADAPDPKPFVSQETKTIPAFPLLVDATAESGVAVEIDVGDQKEFFFPKIMTGGGGLFDGDQDGDLDLLIVGGKTARLFRQIAPFQFEEADSLDLGDSFAMGVAAGDINNDGTCDLYLTCFGKDRLFLGEGKLKYRDITEESEIVNEAWGTSACFLDYDEDGLLDLFVANYVDYTETIRCFDPTETEDFCSPQRFPGSVSRLYHNESKNQKIQFRDVTIPSGIGSQKGPGLGVLSLDFDQNGWNDILVANDGSANFLWMNQGDGTFRDEAIPLGLAYSSAGNPRAGMGIAAADIDGDQGFEVMITHLTGETNGLYQKSQLGWNDRGALTGLGPPSFSLTGFGVALEDLDNDGDIDALVANGAVRRNIGNNTDQLSLPGYAQPNQIFLNEGGTFSLLAMDNHFSITSETSRALITGDLDNDGDLDAVVVNLGSPVKLYRNEYESSGHWLGVRALEQNRDALGAIVIVQSGDRKWTRTVQTASSYLASNDPRLHFGLGNLAKFDSLEVIWPDGSSQTIPGGKADQYLTIHREQP